MIITVIYTTYCSCEKKAWKKYGIQTLDLRDTGAALYQLNNKLNKLHVSLFWEKGIGGTYLKKDVYKFNGGFALWFKFFFQFGEVLFKLWKAGAGKI